MVQEQSVENKTEPWPQSLTSYTMYTEDMIMVQNNLGIYLKT